MIDALADVVGVIMIATDFAENDSFSVYQELSGSELIYTFELYGQLAITISEGSFFLTVLDDNEESQILCDNAVDTLTEFHGAPEEITCDDGSSMPVWKCAADMEKMASISPTLKGWLLKTILL